MWNPIKIEKFCGPFVMESLAEFVNEQGFSIRFNSKHFEQFPILQIK